MEERRQSSSRGFSLCNDLLVFAVQPMTEVTHWPLANSLRFSESYTDGDARP